MDSTSKRAVTKEIISDRPEDDELEFTITEVVKQMKDSGFSSREKEKTRESAPLGQQNQESIAQVKAEISKKQLESAKTLEYKINHILNSLKFNNPKVQERITHIKALLQQHVNQSDFTKN